MNFSAYSGLPVLVTGGLGFIGSSVAVRLAALGAAVTVVDSRVAGCGSNPYNLEPEASGIRTIEADLSEPEVLEDAIRGAKKVFNLAGEISHIHSMQFPERDLQLNTVSQLRFLDACRRWNPGIRVVYAGTRQVLGRPEYLPVDENHPIRPVDFNGVHKYAATMYHLMMSDLGELDAVVLRLTNVYGPRMSLDVAGQGFLGVFFRKALLGEEISIYGDGEQLRDPAHVDDVVDAFLAAGLMKQPGKRQFNIGGPEALSLASIARTICEQVNLPAPQVVPFPPHLSSIDIGSYYTDSSLFEQATGWKPHYRFARGAAQTLDFYRAHMGQYLAPGEPPRRDLPEHQGIVRRLQFQPVLK